MSDSCDPMDYSLQAPLSRQEYWSSLPFPFSGDLPDPGIEPRSPALQADSLPIELAKVNLYMYLIKYFLPLWKESNISSVS